MSADELAAFYRDYIDCLNRQDWSRLGLFVHENAQHNGRRIGLTGYRAMLEGDFLAIPDLRFTIETLVSQPPVIASRLQFDCHPKGMLFDQPVDGRRVRFAENVFYHLVDGRIETVWSIIDTAAIRRQL